MLWPKRVLTIPSRHQASHGKSCGCIWSPRSVFIQHIPLCCWIYPNGSFEKCPNLRLSSDLLLGRKHWASNPATSLHRRHQRSPQSSFVVYLARSSVPHHCMDWINYWKRYSENCHLEMGYGIWCIILPVIFLSLAITLFLNNRKAEKMGLTAPLAWKGLAVKEILKRSWFELDLGGILLLSGAFALILIPLTIASKPSDGCGSSDIIAMLVISIVCSVIFPIWESNRVLAPRPLIPLHLLKSKTFSAGCGVGFFYFSTSH
jgi:hypothetical protein